MYLNSASTTVLKWKGSFKKYGGIMEASAFNT